MKNFKRLFCIFLSALLLLGVCVSCRSQGDESDTDASTADTTDKATSELPNDFVPVIRFAVASDTHITNKTNVEAERMKKLFQSAYRYAESNENYSGLDAVVVVGDLTNRGESAEFRAFMEIVNASVKEETQLITVMGNHDHYNGVNPYKEIINSDLNVDVVINGFHFIGISATSTASTYPSSSVSWLSNAMKDAAAEDSKKPIFTFQHHHLKDTVYVSSEWYSDSSASIRAIYNKYPQTVNFSGHSHGPINLPTSIWQDDFTALGTGTLSYFELTTGMTYGTVPPNAKQAAQYYIVEVDASNTVRILPYNILTDDFFRDPANDGEDKQLIYMIENPSDKSGFRYADRAEKAGKPYFAKDAALSISNIAPRSATLTVPQALDAQAIYSYEITYEGAADKQTVAYFSEFYFEPMPENLSFELNNLTAETKYTVSVVPVNCFGLKGEPIIAEFTTGEREVKEYVSQNPVKYSGTFTNFDSVSELTQSKTTYAYGGTVGGDIFVGDWDSNSGNSNSKFELAQGKGYDGSAALGLWSTDDQNQGAYIFATESNKNTKAYPEITYLRVWVDFSEVSMRKANFGLVSSDGTLYTTDEGDGRTDQAFWYLPEGETEWKRYFHGTDGCFGSDQNSSVRGFKGWMAFPVKDFLCRTGTGSGQGRDGASYNESTTVGIYFFWDYENSSYVGEKFYIDEIHIVEDYRVFEEYGAD